MNLKVMW